MFVFVVLGYLCLPPLAWVGFFMSLKARRQYPEDGLTQWTYRLGLVNLCLGVVFLGGLLHGYLATEVEARKTPAQKERELDAELAKQKERDAAILEGLKAPYPTADVDGQTRQVEILWSSGSAVLILPKTYGFGATRFMDHAVDISGEVRKQLKTGGDYLLVKQTVRAWQGPSPGYSRIDVAIPRRVIPPSFGGAGG